MTPEPETMRKVFTCARCEGIYADEPVTKCDCSPEEPIWREGRILETEEYDRLKEANERADDLRAAANAGMERLRKALEEREDQMIEFRDCVLHERRQLAEENFGSERVNMVLDLFDDIFTEQGILRRDAAKE